MSGAAHDSPTAEHAQTSACHMSASPDPTLKRNYLYYLLNTAERTVSIAHPKRVDVARQDTIGEFARKN